MKLILGQFCLRKTCYVFCFNTVTKIKTLHVLWRWSYSFSNLCGWRTGSSVEYLLCLGLRNALWAVCEVAYRFFSENVELHQRVENKGWSSVVLPVNCTHHFTQHYLGWGWVGSADEFGTFLKPNYQVSWFCWYVEIVTSSNKTPVYWIS